MDREIRKVTFSLETFVGFNPELTPQEEKEQEELTRLRQGYFHGIVKREEKSAQSGNFVEVTYALVEDCETGRMHYVQPELITFIKRKNEKGEI